MLSAVCLLTVVRATKWALKRLLRASFELVQDTAGALRCGAVLCCDECCAVLCCAVHC